MKEHDWSALDLYLSTRYRCTRADIEPTDTPGYWRLKTPCGGKAGGCPEPIHRTLFNDGSLQHTIQFLDKPERHKGRWKGRLTTWKRAHKEMKAKARRHEQPEPPHHRADRQGA